MRNNLFTIPSPPTVGEATGTTKADRDLWWKSFWQAVDEDPETREMVRTWQSAGCDPRQIAVAMHSYVTEGTKVLNDERRERGRRAKNVFTGFAESAKEMEALHRAYGRDTEADRFAAESASADQLTARAEIAYETKRLGVSRSWTDLVKVQGLVFEATGVDATAPQIVKLIRVARRAAGQDADAWETNAASIRKGLNGFRQRNPLQAWLWTNPSQPL